MKLADITIYKKIKKIYYELKSMDDITIDNKLIETTYAFKRINGVLFQLCLNLGMLYLLILFVKYIFF